MKFSLIDSGKCIAKENMAIDKRLLDSLAIDCQPILRFYDWSGNCATHGYFVDPTSYFPSTENLTFAKRPTGGGILFHLWDFTFSVLFPFNHKYFTTNTLQNYKYVNEAVARAVRSFGKNAYLLEEEISSNDPFENHFCMAKPTIYDVMVQGKKLAGGAQRRTRHGYLHQGSISLIPPDLELLYSLLTSENSIVKSIAANSSSLLDGYPSVQFIQEAKEELKNQLIKSLVS